MMLMIPRAHGFRAEPSAYSQVVVKSTGMKIDFLTSDPKGEGSRTFATLFVPMDEVQILLTAILNWKHDNQGTVDMGATIVEGTS